jgi:hypothetical protein
MENIPLCGPRTLNVRHRGTQRSFSHQFLDSAPNGMFEDVVLCRQGV